MLYQQLTNLSRWLRYKATYLELKHHLKQVLKGKEEQYIKLVYERHIGKTVALAKLSAKYKIPLLVSTRCNAMYIGALESKIKYFKKNKPIVYVVNDYISKGLKTNIILVDEGISKNQQNLIDSITSHQIRIERL